VLEGSQAFKALRATAEVFELQDQAASPEPGPLQPRDPGRASVRRPATAACVRQVPRSPRLPPPSARPGRCRQSALTRSCSRSATHSLLRPGRPGRDSEAFTCAATTWQSPAWRCSRLLMQWPAASFEEGNSPFAR